MTAKDVLMPFAIFVCFSLAMGCTQQQPPAPLKPAPPARVTTYDPCFIYSTKSGQFHLTCSWSGDIYNPVRVKSCLQNNDLNAEPIVPSEEGSFIEIKHVRADQYEAIRVANIFRRCIEASG